MTFLIYFNNLGATLRMLGKLHGLTSTVAHDTIAYCGLIPDCFNNMCVRLVFSLNDRNTLKQMTINDCSFGIIQKKMEGIMIILIDKVA